MEKFPIQKFKVFPKLDTAIFDIYLNLSQPNIYWSKTLHPKSQLKSKQRKIYLDLDNPLSHIKYIKISIIWFKGDNFPPSRPSHVGLLLPGHHSSLGLHQGHLCFRCAMNHHVLCMIYIWTSTKATPVL